jgi:methionyl-tRNA synthetase
MLEPFIPFSAERIWIQLGLDLHENGKSVHVQSWQTVGVMNLPPETKLGKVEPLFKKVESHQVEAQKRKLEVAVRNVEN